VDIFEIESVRQPGTESHETSEA